MAAKNLNKIVPMMTDPQTLVSETRNTEMFHDKLIEVTSPLKRPYNKLSPINPIPSEGSIDILLTSEGGKEDFLNIRVNEQFMRKSLNDINMFSSNEPLTPTMTSSRNELFVNQMRIDHKKSELALGKARKIVRDPSFNSLQPPGTVTELPQELEELELTARSQQRDK